jgi:enamine deaminase RidA (YjgF/YER057c/UK114 family)
MQRQCYHANEAIETEIGYCEAVRIGDTLHISGTAGQGDMTAAMRSVYGRLQKTLAANGLGFADVVKENVYATDLDAFIQNKELRSGDRTDRGLSQTVMQLSACAVLDTPRCRRALCAQDHAQYPCARTG